MELTLSGKPFIMIAKEAIEKLLNEYGLPLQIDEKEIKLRTGQFSVMEKSHIGLLSVPVIHEQPDNTAIQVAKLALLMNSCKTGKIAIACTITNPKEGEVKGTEKKVEIESESFNSYFSKFLHTLIGNGADDRDDPCFYYMANGIIRNLKKPYEDGDFVFMEDWSEEELKAIIQYEESQIKKEMNEYPTIGRRLLSLEDRLTDYNVFAGCTKTKIYSFLYDWCVLQGVFNDIGKGFSGSIGKEKFTEVRNRINSYCRKAEKLGLEDIGKIFRVKKED